ncbi:MAG: glycogen synthase [Clostridiales bacterium]
MQNNLKVLFVSSEVYPFAKTGGLADVAMALPQELFSMGHDVRIIMPKYKTIKDIDFKKVTDLSVWVGQRNEKFAIQETKYKYFVNNKEQEVTVYFVDSQYYFDRDKIYDYGDDGERFAFFSKAVLSMLPKISFKPDIIHCNDWHTGLIPMLLKENVDYLKNDYYKNIKTIYSIHNLGYRGDFPKDIILLLGVSNKVFVPDKAEFFGMFSYMKVGIAYADIINTVSKVYALEIQTGYYGERLDGVLRKRTKDLYGIINGIDYNVFNPSLDDKIYRKYSLDNLDEKYVNKFQLQKELLIPQKNVPVISIITRLAEQKGLNLLLEKMDQLMSKDIQLIVLGSGDYEYENGLQYFRDKYPDKIAIYLGFNGVLANKIYAASDMFLMPSRFEPCGLGQLISYKYGTIPIVRSTGGLADTVLDYNGDRLNGTGFTFHDFSSDDMLNAIDRAIELYSGEPGKWKKLVKQAMSFDYSWREPAKEYIELYNKAIQKESFVGIQK